MITAKYFGAIAEQTGSQVLYKNDKYHVLFIT
jgi:hypothetical protein